VNCDAPYGCGTVFKIDTAGNETILYIFTGGTTDGYDPIGGVALDAEGNVYGTAYRGGAYGMGIVFKLGTANDETILHNFTGGADGGYPNASLSLDSSGNVYGTAVGGGLDNYNCNDFGTGCGVVFKVTP